MHAGVAAIPCATRRSRGVTLVELMIGLTVLAILLMSAAPAFSTWIRNTQIRSASESILTGMQLARNEAVRRNTTTRFQLTSTLDGQCTLAGTGRNWVVSMGKDNSPKGKCGAPPDDKVEPFILQKAPVSTNASVTLNAERFTLAFNGLGQQIPVDGLRPQAMATIRIESTQGDCLKADGSGSVRCLRIEVAGGGQSRLCDPALSASSRNPAMACLAK